MKRSFIQPVILLWAVCIAAWAVPASAQSYVAEAESNGFTLKKVVSDTLIATGTNFSYTVYFSIPAGATNVTISDALPPSLSFQAINTTSVCGAPTVSTPTVGSTGGTVSLNWASVPSGCSGSFVITVQFPNGITCDRTAARNNVCLLGMLGPVNVDFCTPYISTTAQASDPWHVGKWVIGAGSQPGPCPNITADSVIKYQVCVYKNVGTTGQLNMANAIVTDTLPPGAILVNSSCGATQTGNVISWNIGALSALPMYNTMCCTFEVLYPPALFPTGTQIKNKATLTGTLGSSNNPCGPAFHQSAETCVEIKTVISNTLSKYVYTNGQPGCGGLYRIWVCNNGSVPIASMTITDTIPASLTGISLGTVSSGLLATLAGNIVTVTLSSPLNPTECRYFEVNFTIPLTATPGTPVTNCAYSAVPGAPPLVTCATFTVTAPAPKPCLWKEVCNKQPNYQPGDVFRYRLRIQNIGGLPISGASITDVLNPNLAYVGSPSYYTGSSWSAPCQTTSNWSGVAFSQVGNTLTFTLPTIPATCQTIFYNNCGMYGTSGVPYYFIEFDVMVKDTAALGNIPNLFTISGGTVTSPVNSNTELVNVVGTSGFTLNKSVAPDTTSWSSSTSVTAGSPVNYRLQFTVAPGSVGLRHITFADLLPMDNPPNDALILGPCSPRGSAFDIVFNSPVSTLPAATGYRNPTSFGNVNVFTPSGAPGPMFTSGCGTAGSWSSGILPNDQNLGWYFGSTPIGASNTATAIFQATVDPAAADNQIACNSFAANAAVRHLINSAVYTDQVTGNLESGTACVTVVKDTGHGKECITVSLNSVVSTGMDPVGNCTYDVAVTINNPGPATSAYFESFQGTVAPPLIPIGSGTTVDTLTFTDMPPSDVFVCIRYGIDDGTGVRRLCDSLCFDLPPCGVSDDCDSLHAQVKSITPTGVDANGDCTYSVDLTFSNTSSGPISVWFDSYYGAVSPPLTSIPVGTSTQTLVFTDTPPANNFVCIRYGVIVPGQPPTRVVCDSVCFDLEPCGQSGDPCDSLKAQLQSVISTGVDPNGDCTYDVNLTFTNSSSSAMTVWFDSFQGTVAPPVLTLPTGTTTQTLSFTDLPPAGATACIRYGYMGAQGTRIICDSVCFDLPPCGESGDCDSLELVQATATAIGVNAAGDCEYTVQFIAINSGASPINIWLSSLSGTVTPASLTIPSGTSTQTVTFADTPPSETFVCIRYGINVNGLPRVCDSICFDLPPCDTEGCDSLMNGRLNDCCDYNVTIANVLGSPITGISYTISGGTVNTITTVPCAPVSPAPTGSTSGTLTYSPPCAGNMNFGITATPTTPSNTITVTLVVYHGKDSCILRFQYNCDPTPLMECDKFSVKPFVSPGLAVSGRSFSIMNTKVPASPITHVTITPVPTPCNMTGGALMVDYTATSWGVPYTRIPVSGFISATAAVSFNLAIDYSCNWTGNVQVVVHHADGDSCVYSYGPWKALLVVGTGGVGTDPIDKKVYANKLHVDNAATNPPVKWVSVNVESSSDKILAGSGAHWPGTTLLPGDESLDGYEQGSTEALYSFERPVAPGMVSGYFNLVIARDKNQPGTPVVRWTMYDTDGNAVATDTVGITTSVLSVKGGGQSVAPNGIELLHFFPNPAAHAATVNYALGSSTHIHLELYNQLGELVETLAQGLEDPGVHSARFDTSALPTGTYYIKLSSPDGHVTKPLVITR